MKKRNIWEVDDDLESGEERQYEYGSSDSSEFLSDSSESGSDGEWGKKKSKMVHQKKHKKKSKERKHKSGSSSHMKRPRVEPVMPVAVPLKKRFALADPSLMEDGEIAESDGSEYRDEYDENLIGDEEDRMKLAQMSEMDRERVIYERDIERNRRKEQWEFARRQRKLKRREKREHGKDDYEDGEFRSNLRSREKSDAQQKRFEMLLNQKARKETLQRQREMGTSGGPEPGWDQATGEPGWADGGKLQTDVVASNDMYYEDSGAVTFEMIQAVTVTRAALESWSDEPFFAELMKGLFVRISIEQQSQYKLAQIVGVRQGSRYALLSGKMTTKRLLCGMGSNTRSFRMIMISNSPPTVEEFEDLKKWRQRAHMDPLRPEDVKIWKKNLKKARNYVYSPEEVDRIVQQKRLSKLENGNLKGVNLFLEMEFLNRLIAVAKEAGNMQDAEHYEKLHNMLKNEQIERDAKRNAEVEQFEAKKARFVNETRLELPSASPGSPQGRHADGLDPFSRRPTLPTVMWQTSKSMKSKEAVVKKEEEPPKEEKKEKVEEKVEEPVVIERTVADVTASILKGMGPSSPRSAPIGTQSALDRTVSHDELALAHSAFELDIDIPTEETPVIEIKKKSTKSSGSIFSRRRVDRL